MEETSDRLNLAFGQTGEVNMLDSADVLANGDVLDDIIIETKMERSVRDH